MGIIAAAMIDIENSVGRTTSLAARATRPAPPRAAGCSWARWRYAFSTRMTAPSSRMPKSMAPIDSMFAGTPAKWRPTNAVSSASGIVIATANEPVSARRKSHSTSATSATPSSMLCETVSSVVSTSCVRS